MRKWLAVGIVAALGAVVCATPGGADGGETCASATPITALPFLDSGNTTGHVNDRGTLPIGCATYVTVDGPDLIYQLSLDVGNDLTITATPGNSMYDPSIYLFQSCGAGEMCIGSKDDMTAGGQEVLTASGLPAGTYFLYVDSFYAVAPAGFGPYTLSVTGSLGAVTITTTTTGPTTSITTTTLPTADTICTGGVSITRAVAKLGKLGGSLGDETFVFGGTLGFPAGTPAALDPAGRGLQILVEDLGGAMPVLLDWTAGSTPIPPGGPGSGCGAKDGWKKLGYRNRSGALAPPACPAGSAQGLRVVRLKDKRAKGGGIAFVVQGRGVSLPTPTGQLRMTLVLGADASAGSAGECGSHAFAVGACRLKRATMRCK